LFVDRTGDKFLTRAAFTSDEPGGVSAERRKRYFQTMAQGFTSTAR